MTDQPMISANKVLDCKGLACPMPIVRTKKAMDELQPGQVIEVQATDKGSLADIQGWAKNTGHQYVGTIHEGDVLRHFLRKASAQEAREETKYPRTISNDELAAKLQNQEPIVVLDVREPAEYAFHRIPGSKSIPLGVLEERLGELRREDEVYVVCRTGNRSDLACQLLAENGFARVSNVLPGMSGWSGPREATSR